MNLDTAIIEVERMMQVSGNALLSKREIAAVDAVLDAARTLKALRAGYDSLRGVRP